MLGQPPSYPATSPYAPYPYLPVPPPPPRVRHSPLGWAVVAFSALCILVSAWVGLSTALISSQRAASFHAAGEVEAPPDADAPASDWNRWARRAVDVALSTQARALVDGDEEGFLAAVDPGRSRLLDEFERRYEVLSTMGVGQWDQVLRGRPKVTGQLTWHADVELSYCFGDPSCRPSSVVFGTDWEFVEGRLVLTKLTNSSANESGPRPWETGDVVVATGARAIVVASSNLRYRLDRTLDEAEQAARVADSLAGPQGPPSRYVLYLAYAAPINGSQDLVDCADVPATDWTTWFGDKPCWSGGMYLDETDNEVIVNGAQDLIQDTVTHEFTHASTLGGQDHNHADNVWWLVEGIAEYGMMIGRPISDYDMDHLRPYIRDTWNGCPDDPVAVVCPPPYTVDDPVLVNGPYGVAFLTVRHLADAYGQDAMLSFFDAVVLDRRPFDAASRAAFGKAWADVLTECQTFVRYA